MRAVDVAVEEIERLCAEVERLRSQLMDAAYWLYDLREGCLPDACWPEIDALIETHTFGGEQE